MHKISRSWTTATVQRIVQAVVLRGRFGHRQRYATHVGWRHLPTRWRHRSQPRIHRQQRRSHQHRTSQYTGHAERRLFCILRSGGCPTFISIRIYFIMCESIVVNYAIFPNTTTGPDLTSIVQKDGVCVDHAVEEQMPSYLCKGDGNWYFPTGRCKCMSGYEPDSMLSYCTGTVHVFFAFSLWVLLKSELTYLRIIWIGWWTSHYYFF